MMRIWSRSIFAARVNQHPRLPPARDTNTASSPLWFSVPNPFTPLTSTSTTAASREIPTFPDPISQFSCCAVISITIRATPSIERPSDQRHIGKVPRITVLGGRRFTPSNADPRCATSTQIIFSPPNSNTSNASTPLGFFPWDYQRRRYFWYAWSQPAA